MQKIVYGCCVPWWKSSSLAKTLLVMKLTIFLLTVTFLNVYADGRSQTITFSGKNVELKKVFTAIKKQTGYVVFYNRSALNGTSPVTLSVHDMPLHHFLDVMLKDQPLAYKIEDKTIMLYRRRILREVPYNEPAMEEVDRIIKGKVTDSKGEPLQNVSVVVVGSQGGTTTNNEGQFSITAPDNSNIILEFSSVGYQTRRISVGNQTEVGVVLELEVAGLSDVVVVGYGTQKRRNITGAVGSLKIAGTPLSDLPNPNILDAIKGRIPGFSIGAVNNAGGNPSRTIRGQNSISASTSPLIVVDGVIFTGSFNEINPNDVESVDILKDASSTAIFGSQGNSGVILITTKMGKSGKPVINTRLNMGYQTHTMKKPDMRKGEDFIQYRRDYMRLQNNKTDIPIDQLLNPNELKAYNEDHTVDWWKAVVRPAPFRDAQLNVSGGSDKFSYYVSGSYLNQEGIVYNDQFKRFTILSKLEAKITDWLKFGLTLSASSKNADGVAADLEKGTINGPYGYEYVTFPGYENWLERYPQSSSTTFNPLWRTLTYDEDRNQNYRSTTFLKVNIPWIKGLSYTFNYSLNRWEGHGSRFSNEKTFVNTAILSELQDQTKYLPNANGFRNNSERTDWYLNHLINFNNTYFGKHEVDLTLVAERQENKTRFMRLDARDFSLAGTTVLGVNALELGDPTKRTVNTNDTRITQLAYLARLNYVFSKKLFFSGSVRKDGYSGFAEGKKYGVFPAASIGYAISNEPFFKNNIANYLKLRLSYGEIGNASIGAYGTFPNISNRNYLFGATPVITSYVSNLANKSVTWERTTSLNIGFDFGILKNILSGSLDLYKSNTHNLLLNRIIPSISGFTSVSGNIGKLANKGIELQIISQNFNKKDFSWQSGFNFWINRNKIVSLYGLDGNGDGKEDDDIANSRFIGKSLGAVFNYVYDGIVQESDTAFTRVYGDKPGDVKFRDINGDKKLNADDRSIIGYTKENYTASISNTFRYKGFELYFMFFTIQGGGKQNWYVGANSYALNPATWYPNVANWLNKDYWMPETPSEKIPKPNYVNKYNYNFIADRSFIRLQDVTLSYRFNKDLLGHTPITGLRVYLSGKNLWTITKWEGLDPETATTYASQNGFPVFKIITAGLSLTL